MNCKHVPLHQRTNNFSSVVLKYGVRITPSACRVVRIIVSPSEYEQYPSPNQFRVLSNTRRLFLPSNSFVNLIASIVSLLHNCTRSAGNRVTDALFLIGAERGRPVSGWSEVSNSGQREQPGPRVTITAASRLNGAARSRPIRPQVAAMVIPVARVISLLSLTPSQQRPPETPMAIRRPVLAAR